MHISEKKSRDESEKKIDKMCDRQTQIVGFLYKR